MKTGMKILVVLLASAFLAGCSGDDEAPEDRTAYDGWMLTRWDDSSALAGKVYLQLEADGDFTLYQCLETYGFTRYTGTYSVTDESGRQLMSGTYADGTAWKHAYEIESRGDKIMVMTSSGEQILSEYERVAVPEYVKYDDTFDTPDMPDERSGDGVEPFL